ncbi:MAG TPA: hypothetical protein VJR48_07105 [Ktedonobacterales bacterium]|jgi:hypothetical protein|nr:MAG: hypothetical protein OJF49_001575 [Ktedonobacterales bacterium]HKT38126.1 hypothetical protein [Ktedonobacterales bacterium]
MKRAQVAALLAGAALGLAGVAVGITLSRKEGREAARRMLEKATPVAEQARQVGSRVAKTASEQYQTLAPKAAGVISTVRAQAPQAAEAISAKLPWVSPNGKTEPAQIPQ